MPAAFDFAVTSGLQSTLLSQVATDGSIPTAKYEEHKRSYLNTDALCRTEGLLFIPMVAEGVGGGWGPCAQRVFHDLAKMIATNTDQQPDRVREDMYRSFSIIIHREGARAILRRLPGVAPASPQQQAAQRAALLASADVTHELA